MRAVATVDWSDPRWSVSGPGSRGGLEFGGVGNGSRGDIGERETGTTGVGEGWK